MATLKTVISSDIDDVFMQTNDFAESCGYVQGDAEPVTVIAIPFAVEYETQDSDGFATRFISTDWLIPVDDLTGVTPRPGDRIRRTVGTETHVYEIMPVDSSRAAVALEDTGYMWRLHSKLIRKET